MGNEYTKNNIGLSSAKKSFFGLQKSTQDNGKQIHKNPIQNEHGMASLETVVLLGVLTALFFYSFGFFGATHTGILHNIHARTYALETFRHRSNLTYFRSNRASGFSHYNARNSRLHGINSIGGGSSQLATERPISFGLVGEEQGREAGLHNNQIPQRIPASARNSDLGVNPIWIMVQYGICFNSSCRRGN